MQKRCDFIADAMELRLFCSNASVIIGSVGSILSGVTDPTWWQTINTLRSRQNGLYFADDIFKFIFLIKIVHEFWFKFD